MDVPVIAVESDVSFTDTENSPLEAVTLTVVGFTIADPDEVVKLYVDSMKEKSAFVKICTKKVRTQIGSYVIAAELILFFLLLWKYKIVPSIFCVQQSPAFASNE